MVVARWVWVWVLMLVVGCHATIPPLPSRGGPAWFEVKSANFTLWTDAPAPRGQELVRELEQRRQVIMRAMNHAEQSSRIFVIALRSGREVAAYAPDDVAALAWPGSNPSRQPGILMAASSEAHTRVLNHELAHAVSFAIIKSQASWLMEGIATYFELADLDPDRGTVQVGRPSADHLRWLRTPQPVPAAELFACEALSCMDARFYATSWAMFSFLLNEHFEQLGRYLRRVTELPRDERAGVWREVFPDLPFDKLDRDLQRWLASGSFALPRIKVATEGASSTVRGLGDGDVLAARSLLTLIIKDDEAAARTGAAAALAVDPTNVLALLIQSVLTRSLEPDAARATAAAHPDDWRAWLLVRIAMGDSPEGHDAASKLCALTVSQDRDERCDHGTR